MKSLFYDNPLIRIWRTARFLAAGRRVHPTVSIIGSLRNLSVGRRTSIGKRSQLRLIGAGRVVIGDGVWISSDTEVETSGNVAIGAGTTVQRRSTINGNVTLGEECILAPNVFISSGTHPFRAAPHLSIREQERQIASGQLAWDKIDRPVVIGNDCWLGTNVVVCPGVKIGDGSVIGANSVVTRDVQPGSVMAGCPAREIGNRLAKQGAYSG